MLHWQRGKKGRGTREIFYEKDEPVLVEGIFEWGKKAIFPNGKSQHGLLSSIEVCLSNYVSERIDTFQTTEGEECSLQEYLKSCGMFSSQFYIYLKTKTSEAGDSQSASDEEHIERKQELLVNGTKPCSIEIRYR